ncbi:MAG: tetratricopeptide repeat protein [Pyrinomonadaceae bacterium]
MKTRIKLCLVILVLLLADGGARAATRKDEWLHVRSANFNLIGNASEKEIRRVGTKLEQFREVFRSVFGGAKLDSPIPTNVIVFKSDSAYKPFKPKRGDGKIDNFVAGYFQPGRDVNYITLSTSGTDAETYGTIFHEYVHFVVNTHIGKSGVPAWFNEGLAEYYQTFLMEDDVKAKLGMPQDGHLRLLQQAKLIPLDSFFNTSNSQLQGHGSGSRSLFYAQAWAVVHYLIANNKADGIDKYLRLSMKGTVDEAAFRDAFQMTYAEMEKELRRYVGRASYRISVVTFTNKLNFDADMKVSPLTDAESNAYLGDLLYHTNRFDDAEPYLQAALTADPGSGMANTSMGMVKVRQRKYSEAKVYLDKAIETDPKNHLAYYYAAYLLSREGRDEFGYVSGFDSTKTTRMRELLEKAIQLNPSFTESYDLLAFVSLVGNQGIEEAVALMAKALKYQPGNQRYVLRIAELYVRQEKFNAAEALAKRIAATSDEQQIKDQADNILKQIQVRNEIAARNAEARNRYQTAAAGGKGGPPQLIRRDAETSPEELRKKELEYEVRVINRELRAVENNEVRFIGKLENVACKGAKITYTVISDSETFALTSKDFQGLHLTSYVPDAGNAEIACNARTNVLKAVLTYRPINGATGPAVRGDLVSVEFVPDHFRFMEPAPLPGPQRSGDVVIVDSASGSSPGEVPTPEKLEERRRSIVFSHIRQNLRKPGRGEVRVIGFIEKSECSNKGAFFFIKTPTQLLKLKGGAASMRGFTPEIENLQIGCGMTAVDIPVVVTYSDAFDKKSKSNGSLVSLEFVPKNFVLEP